MSLYAGPRPRGGKLDGPERGMDAIVGLILLIAEVMIGLLVVFTLLDYGVACAESDQCAPIEGVQAGFLIVVIGGGLAVLITTLVYLGRVIAGRRSWGAPLTGGILFGIAAFIGWLVMTGGA